MVEVSLGDYWVEEVKAVVSSVDFLVGGRKGGGPLG
jgi:hypothetical protein